MVNSHRLMTFMEVGFYSFVFCYIIDIHVIMSLIMAKGGGDSRRSFARVLCIRMCYQYKCRQLQLQLIHLLKRRSFP